MDIELNILTEINKQQQQQKWGQTDKNNKNKTSYPTHSAMLPTSVKESPMLAKSKLSIKIKCFGYFFLLSFLILRVSIHFTYCCRSNAKL